MTFIKWLFDTHNMLLYEYEDLPKDMSDKLAKEYWQYVDKCKLEIDKVTEINNSKSKTSLTIHNGEEVDMEHVESIIDDMLNHINCDGYEFSLRIEG